MYLGMVPHLVWAAVAFGVLGVVIYRLKLFAVRSVHEQKLKALEQRQAVLDLSVSKALGLEAEVARIRESLEKLKAIPPKPPRF